MKNIIIFIVCIFLGAIGTYLYQNRAVNAKVESEKHSKIRPELIPGNETKIKDVRDLMISEVDSEESIKEYGQLYTTGSIGNVPESINLDKIPHLQIISGKPNERFSFLVDKKVIKKYIPAFDIQKVYLYDSKGFLTEITDIVGYQIDALGILSLVSMKFKIPEEFQADAIDRHDLYISTVKIHKPIFDESYTVSEKINRKMASSICNDPISEDHRWFELKNKEHSYISYSPNVNHYEANSKYFFVKKSANDYKKMIFKDKTDGFFLGYLKATNFRFNGEPVFEASLSVFEGHSEAVWYLYYDGKEYKYKTSKFYE